MKYRTEFPMRLMERALREGILDWIIFWEDMAYRTASLISPAMFRDECPILMDESLLALPHALSVSHRSCSSCETSARRRFSSVTDRNLETSLWPWMKVSA